MRLYLEGKGFCEIDRTLNVNVQTIANWVNTYYAAQLSVWPKVTKIKPQYFTAKHRATWLP